jgi:hypothetical protein
MGLAISADSGRFDWRGSASDWQRPFTEPRNLLSLPCRRMLAGFVNSDGIAGHRARRLRGVSSVAISLSPNSRSAPLTEPSGADEMLDVPAENFVATHWLALAQVRAAGPRRNVAGSPRLETILASAKTRGYNIPR